SLAAFPNDGQALLYRYGRITLVPNLGLGPGALATYGTAVNNKGVAVGFEKDAPSDGPAFPFLFDANGQVTSLPVLFGSGKAYDINNNGFVTGLAGFARGQTPSAVFLYDGQNIRTIGPVSSIFGPPNIGFGLNDRNEVVGVISEHAFYYDGVKITDL